MPCVVIVEKRAGDVKGTPDWQLDRMYETDTAEKLASCMNSEDDFPASNIADFLSQVDYFVGQAVLKLARAADLAEGWNKEESLDKLLERLEDWRCDAKSERRRLCGNR